MCQIKRHTALGSEWGVLQGGPRLHGCLMISVISRAETYHIFDEKYCINIDIFHTGSRD